ncbi:LytR/AlgR family response regulator transcription factor [Spirosoma pomorum]
MKANVSPVGLPVSPCFPLSYQRGTHRIALPYLNRTIYISADDVVCLEGEGNYTFLYTRDQKRYLVSKTLKDFEKMMDESLFLRTHKSYMVNLAYVQPNTLNRERQVVMVNGREVGISRRRMKAIAQQLAQFWHRNHN